MTAKQKRRRRGRPPGLTGSLTIDLSDRTLKMDLIAGADEVDATLASFVERLLLHLRPVRGDTGRMVRAYAEQLGREVARGNRSK